MDEKLKFTVTYSKTINLGDYESEKYGLTQEFYEGDCTVRRAFSIVMLDVKDVMNDE